MIDDQVLNDTHLFQPAPHASFCNHVDSLIPSSDVCTIYYQFPPKTLEEREGEKTENMLTSSMFRHK